MKISPISISHASNLNSTKKNHHHQYHYQPSFGNGATRGIGWGALLGGILTAMSGGALFWTVPALSGIGGIGGDILEKNCSKSSPSNADNNQYARVPWRIDA